MLAEANANSDVRSSAADLGRSGFGRCLRSEAEIGAVPGWHIGGGRTQRQTISEGLQSSGDLTNDFARSISSARLAFAEAAYWPLADDFPVARLTVM